MANRFIYIKRSTGEVVSKLVHRVENGEHIIVVILKGKGKPEKLSREEFFKNYDFKARDKRGIPKKVKHKNKMEDESNFIPKKKSEMPYGGSRL